MLSDKLFTNNSKNYSFKASEYSWEKSTEKIIKLWNNYDKNIRSNYSKIKGDSSYKFEKNIALSIINILYQDLQLLKGVI